MTEDYYTEIEQLSSNHVIDTLQQLKLTWDRAAYSTHKEMSFTSQITPQSKLRVRMSPILFGLLPIIEVI